MTVGKTDGTAAHLGATLVRLPGVYRPQEDSYLLARELARETLGPDTRVLDVGAGTGVLSVTAGLAGAGQVTAVDVGRRALATTWINAALNGVRVRVRRGDLLQAVRGEQFDVVVSNPPYVPAADDLLPAAGPARCWDAGRDGRAHLDRICRAAPEVLAPGGVLLLLQSALSDIDRSMAMLAAGGLDVELAAEESIPFGPVLQSRADMLRRRGLLGPHEDRETIAVLRAVK